MNVVCMQNVSLPQKPFMRHYYSRNFIGTPNHAISGFANDLCLSQNVTNVY